MRGLYIQRASAMAPIAKDSEVQNSAAPASAVGATQPKVQPVALEIAVTVNGARAVEGSDKREPFSETTQTVLVKARISNGNDALRQSQFIRARVIWGTHQNPEVPILAVSRLAGQYFAFVAEDTKKGPVARQRAVALGDLTGNDYVVRAGLRPGERIVVSGVQKVRDGSPLSPSTTMRRFFASASSKPCRFGHCASGKFGSI